MVMPTEWGSRPWLVGAARAWRSPTRHPLQWSGSPRRSDCLQVARKGQRRWGTIGAGTIVTAKVQRASRVRPVVTDEGRGRSATRLEHTGRGTPWQIAYSGAVG